MGSEASRGGRCPATIQVSRIIQFSPPLRPRCVTAPQLVVVTCSEAFSSLWEELASGIGAGFVLSDSVDGAELGRASAVLVGAGGVEEKSVEVVRSVRSSCQAPVAVVAAAADHRLAVQILGAGAQEYFALPVDLEPLKEWLQARAASHRARAGAKALAASQQERFDFSELVGESPGLKSTLDRAARIIPRGDATILISGETGTGKELLARAIHYNGPRADSPFVEVNCAALPAGLLEAELFGYEKGAFTDAKTAKPGLFEAADGGTLLLDEAGELPLELQAKLLTVLQGRTVRRLGSVRQTATDVRIIAASHVDLARAVREGRFRQDLFYRLSVVPLHLPPLRERGRDILILAEHFLRTLGESYGIEVPSLQREVETALLSHGWPGNVRELRNAIERALLLGGGVLHPDDLFLDSPVEVVSQGSALPFPARLDEIERVAARLALERAEGNKSMAADTLGISRSRLYRLLDE